VNVASFANVLPNQAKSSSFNRITICFVSRSHLCSTDSENAFLPWILKVVHSFEFDSVTQKHANMLILKDETASLTQGCNAKKKKCGNAPNTSHFQQHFKLNFKSIFNEVFSVITLQMKTFTDFPHIQPVWELHRGDLSKNTHLQSQVATTCSRPTTPLLLPQKIPKYLNHFVNYTRFP